MAIMVRAKMATVRSSSHKRRNKKMVQGMEEIGREKKKDSSIYQKEKQKISAFWKMKCTEIEERKQQKPNPR